ncbi:glycosyltransferase family 4 protein [Engelhardtia mirabilis]|uniref:D-inositol 3-phosphate glycosyltransferase n=1 Tax=Engelhardtia mirabilis TaxID=2528011 RepID=A0A518BNU6_9BACT|nr:D-inositol 3-phosphate glycosyltransferase [Planctomycetes bacterium Pla133]QDV02975.1 D-inositol 3-phosphate glycosyltransferase [Planctomycetes bacterium Pla86]
MSARSPRVLVLGAVLGQPRGGVQRHNAELLPRAARLLRARGGSLAVLVGAEPPSFDCGEDVELLESAVPAGPPARRARAESRAVAAAIDHATGAGSPFDLVHTAHLPIPSKRGLRGTPLTVTLHDLRQVNAELVGSLRAFAGRFAYRAVARRAARLLFVSDEVRAQFQLRHPRVVGRADVVPNAGDHLRVVERGARARSYLEPGYLLHVGHLEPRKNLGLALRALAEDPALPPLVLVGAAKGGERARLDRLAAQLGVGARVWFLGPLDDSELPLLYAGAGCLVLPSRLEGFGIPVHEARRAGLPLALSRSGAPSEVAGDAAERFDADDPAEMAAAIRIALAKATTPCVDLESWDDSAARLVAAWEAAVASPRG